MQEFDINAPIEQQFTRDGRKVLAIFNSGLDVMFPLAVYVEGNTGAGSYTIEGKYYGDETECDDDISTHTEIKYYLTTYFEGVNKCSLYSYQHETLEKALKSRDNKECLLIVEICVNPQTLESSARTVWKKSEN